MKLSVIVPNYNNSKYLNNCLDSIISQTYKDLEIIIVDDCSTDNSIEIINTYLIKDNRIKLIVNKTNQGISRVRDIGIKSAISQWITTLDSDDYYLDYLKLEKEMNIILKYNKNNIVAYSGIVQVDEIGNELTKIMTNHTIREGYLFEDMITRNFAIPRDFIFSKELYIDVGGFDYNIPLYEDWDLKVRLSKKAYFYYSGIDGIAYRRHGKGLSSAKQLEHQKWVKYIFDKNSKNLLNKQDLEVILRKNFNFNKPLDSLAKNIIVNDLIKQIKESDIKSFSIFGISELTELFLIKLSLENINKNINFIIDSKAKYTIFTYHEKIVISPQMALEKGETNFLLIGFNNINVLENILKDLNKFKKLIIIKPNIKGF